MAKSPGYPAPGSNPMPRNPAPMPVTVSPHSRPTPQPVTPMPTSRSNSAPIPPLSPDRGMRPLK